MSSRPIAVISGVQIWPLSEGGSWTISSTVELVGLHALVACQGSAKRMETEGKGAHGREGCLPALEAGRSCTLQPSSAALATWPCHRPPATSTRSWGGRSRVLLSRHPRPLSGIRLPRYRPALVGAGAGLVPGTVKWPPCRPRGSREWAGCERLGPGRTEAPAGVVRVEPRAQVCVAGQVGRSRRCLEPDGAARPGPTRGKHATLRGRQLKHSGRGSAATAFLPLLAPVLRLPTRPGPGTKLSRVSSELRVLGWVGREDLKPPLPKKSRRKKRGRD